MIFNDFGLICGLKVPYQGLWGRFLRTRKVFKNAVAGKLSPQLADAVSWGFNDPRIGKTPQFYDLFLDWGSG